MSENITVNLENLSDNERQTLIKIVERANTSKANGVFVPKHGEKYYAISDGVNLIFSPNSSQRDENRFIIGNCFRTEKEAKAMVEHLRIHRELQLFAAEHNDKDYNWDSTSTEKWLLIKIRQNKITADYYLSSYYANTVYFTSQRIAEDAIKTIGEERLLKYYFA